MKKLLLGLVLSGLLLGCGSEPTEEIVETKSELVNAYKLGNLVNFGYSPFTTSGSLGITLPPLPNVPTITSSFYLTSALANVGGDENNFIRFKITRNPGKLIVGGLVVPGTTYKVSIDAYTYGVQQIDALQLVAYPGDTVLLKYSTPYIQLYNNNATHHFNAPLFLQKSFPFAVGTELLNTIYRPYLAINVDNCFHDMPGGGLLDVTTEANGSYVSFATPNSSGCHLLTVFDGQKNTVTWQFVP